MMKSNEYIWRCHIFVQTSNKISFLLSLKFLQIFFHHPNHPPNYSNVEYLWHQSIYYAYIGKWSIYWFRIISSPIFVSNLTCEFDMNGQKKSWLTEKNKINGMLLPPLSYIQICICILSYHSDNSFTPLHHWFPHIHFIYNCFYLRTYDPHDSFLGIFFLFGMWLRIWQLKYIYIYDVGR